MIFLIKNSQDWHDWVISFKGFKYPLGSNGRMVDDLLFEFPIDDDEVKLNIEDFVDVLFMELPPELELFIRINAGRVNFFTINNKGTHALLQFYWSINLREWLDSDSLNPLLVRDTVYRIFKSQYEEQPDYLIYHPANDDGFDDAYDGGELNLYFNFKFPTTENVGESINLALLHIEDVYQRAINDLTGANTDPKKIIERILEFPKEHYQAGVSILAYFDQVIKQKYPDIAAKVSIEQDSNIVRMIVETPDGCRDIIEKTLDTYALVVSKNEPPESLFEDQIHIQALTNKLSVAELEVRMTKELLLVSENNHGGRIRSLEEEIRFLRQHLGQQMHQVTAYQSIVQRQSEKEERLLLSQAGNSQRTINDLVQEVLNNTELKDALIKIDEIVVRGPKPEDEQDFKAAAKVVNKVSPSSFQELYGLIKNSLYGVSGNYVFQWLQRLG
jgi:hypothetical protein